MNDHAAAPASPGDDKRAALKIVTDNQRRAEEPDIPVFTSMDAAAQHLEIGPPPAAKVARDERWRSYTSLPGKVNCSVKMNPDGSGVLRRFSANNAAGDEFAAWAAPLREVGEDVDEDDEASPEPLAKSNAEKKDERDEQVKANRAYLAGCVPASPTNPAATGRGLDVTHAGWLQEPPRDAAFGAAPVARLVVPFYDGSEAEPVAYQSIAPRGAKLPKKSSPLIGGTFTMLGPPPEPGKPMLCAPSPTTGLALAVLTGLPVIATAGDANLFAGAARAASMFPGAIPVPIADDDWKGDPAKVGNNHGIETARVAAEKLGVPGNWIAPDFSGVTDRRKDETDFLDLIAAGAARGGGENVVAAQLHAAIDMLLANEPPATPEQAEALGNALAVPLLADVGSACAYLKRRYGYITKLGIWWDRRVRAKVSAENIDTTMSAHMPKGKNGKPLKASVLLRADPDVNYDTFDYHPGRGPSFVDPERGLRLLNTYTPPAHNMTLGMDRTADTFIEHVRFLWDDNPEAVDRVIWTLARYVQKPGEKITWAPLHVAPCEGLGRQVLFLALQRLLGSWNVGLGDFDRISGRFNALASGVQVLFIPEMFGGDSAVERKSAWDSFKTVISDDTITLELKGVDAVQIPNRLNVFMCSNHKDAAPLGASDRRAWVHETLRTPKEAAYYDRVYSWFDDPANVVALRRHLLSVDLSASGNHPKRVPADTEAKEAMKARAKPVAEQIAEEAYESRTGVFAHDLFTGSELTEWARHHARVGSPQNAATLAEKAGCFRVANGAGVRLYGGGQPKMWACREKLGDHTNKTALLNLLNKRRGDETPFTPEMLNLPYVEMPGNLLAALYENRVAAMAAVKKDLE